MFGDENRTVQLDDMKVPSCRMHEGWTLDPRTGTTRCSCGRRMYQPDPEPEPQCECHVVRNPPCWACESGLITWD